MIIKKLTMNNFGVYAGLNSFEFSGEHPIVLIGGMNGRGKTTFLEAILLALYGPNSSSCRESAQKTYGQYLRAHVNKNHLDAECYVELQFYMDDHDKEEYVIRRSWSARTKRSKETVTVKQNGAYSAFLTENWPMFIENLLPSALSSFYFFDGEKIAELAVDNTNLQMKYSIRAMLGINVLDVLKNDLVRSLRRTNKKANQTSGAEQLQNMRQERENLRTQIEQIDGEAESLCQKIIHCKKKIDQLSHRYETQGGAVSEQRNMYIMQRSQIVAELEQTDALLMEIASEELPLLLVRDFIPQIKLQAEDEHNDLIMKQAVSNMEDLLREYAKHHQKQVASAWEFIQYVDQQTKEKSTEVVYNLSDHALFQLNSLLSELLDQSKERTTGYLGKKKSLQKKMDEIDSYLSLDINEGELKILLEKINGKKAELEETQHELSRIEERRSALNGELIEKTAKFRTAVEEYLSNEELADEAERSAKYTNLALNIVEEYTVALQKRKIDVLGETITRCYKKLANKKNLIEKIIMDPVTLDTQYLDQSGAEVSKESLSAGEKQLMVIAILWALAICSKKKLPVIIDTPLSRLDSMHRTSMVTTYFPNASDQTIILSTDSEIDGHYYEMMKESVGDEFTLKYDEETKSTTILKGYQIGQ